MSTHQHQTRILGRDAVALGRSHIDPATLRVDGQPVPDWLIIDAEAGLVRRTDGIVGDRTIYTFEFMYDDLAAQRQAALLAKAAAAHETAAAAGWADWTVAQALTWHQQHVDAALAGLAEASSAQPVVVDVLCALAEENKALLQLVIAQRNARWPDLEGQAED